MLESGRLAMAGVLLAAATVSGSAARAETIAISCGAVGLELKICQEGAEIWAKKTGHQVNVVSTPNSATERLALYQQILAASSPDIDVFQIDVIWPGTLANHFVDLKSHVPADVLASHFEAIVENNTVNGKLVAMPWYTDAGVLYYRKDLLDAAGKQPPQTWEELGAIAKELQDKARSQGNDRMWGYVFQGKAYEGLTCNALEWIDSYGGGRIVDDKGKVTVDNDKAVRALTWAASTVGTIAPEGVLNYSEEESRGVFQSGNAIFMRNWPYAWALAQAEDSPIKGKIGVVPLPKGGPDGKHTGALGGWQLAVSKYSRHPEIAIDLVRYLTSAEEQKRRAVAGSYNPTIKALYQDQDVLKAVPFFGTLYETFTNAVARPSRITGAKYNQMSAEFFNAVHQVLSKQEKPAESLAALEKRLDRLSRGGRW
ncbi:ABC transporter substrate-binding protein [Benzoatithermus flavus]|uniref:ABC transporter substrate-binding protein n=1 Tax=Benzoatithermus flavus TaxID=3108223 RepID=A0ABU8XXJ4_9PROT